MPRVLVIEDDAAISALMADGLRASGFEVDTAENGAAGMAKLDASPPDLITLDLMMPVMDGWEFMRLCREAPDCADRPILVTSAVRTRPELFGRWEFLAKPFDLDEFIGAVARMAASPAR